MAEGAFYRDILISPEPGRVVVELEDDYHRMQVVLEHDGETIIEVSGRIHRAPWSTCPGATEAIRGAFRNMPLTGAARAGGKRQNCTHLFDMAQIAAAHATESSPRRLAVRVADPQNGMRNLALYDNNALAMQWSEQDGTLSSPADIAGLSLFGLGEWIAGLSAEEALKARVLRWAAIVAHGRQIPLENQSDATKIPPNCFTFQPGRKEKAVRIGKITEFTGNPIGPLADLERQ